MRRLPTVDPELLKIAACWAALEESRRWTHISWHGIATRLGLPSGDIARELCKKHDIAHWQLQSFIHRGGWAELLHGRVYYEESPAGPVRPQKAKRGPEPAQPQQRFPRDFVAFDVETTGSSKQDRVIQLGLVAYKEGAEVFTWESLFDPEGREIHWRARQVHGIAARDLYGKPPFTALAKRVQAYLKRLGCVVAHNLPYDKRMVSQDLARAGLVWPLHESQCICTQKLARKAGLPQKLSGLCKAFGISLENHHDALADARAAGQAYLALADRLEKEATAQTTLLEVS